MRAFIAIEVPSDIRNDLSHLQDQIKLFDESAKITYPKEFHLTLKFLGEIDDSKIEQIRSLLRKVPFTSFSIRLEKTGYFDDKELKVVWAGIRDTFETVADLQKAVDKQLIYFFPKEPKFHPHLTLARIKRIDNPALFIEKLNSLKIEEKNFPVTSFKLIKSELHKEGPVYTTIEEYK